MADYRSLLEKVGGRIHPSGDAFERLVRGRSRRIRRRRVGAAFVGLTMAAVGVAGATLALGGFGAEEPAPAENPSPIVTGSRTSADPSPADGPTVEPLALPEEVPLKVLAVRTYPPPPSFVLIDLRARTRTLSEAEDHGLPGHSIDGAVITGRGETIVWQNGVARVLSVGSSREIGPHPVRQIPEAAPALRVVPTPDGGAAWLVQVGIDCCGIELPTLISLVDIVDGTVLLSASVDGKAIPEGATEDGLVLNTDELVETKGGWVTEPGSERIILLAEDGETTELAVGQAVGVGPDTILRLECANGHRDCDLHVTSAIDGDDRLVEPPIPGQWRSVSGPFVPSDTMPLNVVSPDGSRALISIGQDLDVNGTPARSTLVQVDLEDGSTWPLWSFDGGPPGATWSRDGRWIVLMKGSNITLRGAPGEGGFGLEDVFVLEGVVPDDHYVFAAG